jgi:hypothetical protein
LPSLLLLPPLLLLMLLPLLPPVRLCAAVWTADRVPVAALLMLPGQLTLPEQVGTLNGKTTVAGQPPALHDLVDVAEFKAAAAASGSMRCMCRCHWMLRAAAAGQLPCCPARFSNSDCIQC